MKLYIPNFRGRGLHTLLESSFSTFITYCIKGAGGLYQYFPEIDFLVVSDRGE